MNAAKCRNVPGKRPVYAETFFVVPSSEYATLRDIYFSDPPKRFFYVESYH